MNIFKKILGFQKPAVTTSNEEFWNWFFRHATEFHDVVKKHADVNEAFLEKLMVRLQNVNPNFYCLTGMLDDDTAELIVTSDGVIKSFVFVEEFVRSAPAMDGWKFTALKPRTNITSFSLEANGYSFCNSKIKFCYNNHEAYPDDIDISLIYEGYTEENKENIVQGCRLFIENSLGELDMATMIDDVTVIARCPEDKEPIPIDKLQEFIHWREKELVEKYDGAYPNPGADTYAIMKAKDKNGLPVIAVINQDLLDWDAKASHPWMMVVEITYNGKDRNGMPENQTTVLMEQFEDELTAQLSPSAGYLHIGRETYNNNREIYFACKEFRFVSKATAMVIDQYKNRLPISYDIYKDRYWRSVDQYRKTRTI